MQRNCQSGNETHWQRPAQVMPGKRQFSLVLVLYAPKSIKLTAAHSPSEGTNIILANCLIYDGAKG